MLLYLNDKVTFVGLNHFSRRQREDSSALRDLRTRMRNPETNLFVQLP